MRKVWRYSGSLGLILAGLFFGFLARGQTSPEASGYVPGTPAWVPLIDACMARGGGRNDCIEALPPEMYAEFLAWEQGRAAERRALFSLPRTPWVPAAKDLPEIYRSPLSLPELPAEIASSLEQSGCLIPQGLSGHSNVVVGELATAGQQDIAAICSVDGISRIEIFWGGDASCPDLQDDSPDWGLLYQEAEWEYYRAISIADPAHIRQYYDKYPEECPADDLPPLDHDGLEDIIVEKGSSNLYCHEGRWLSLCGGD
jgi:hypothetical protein